MFSCCRNAQVISVEKPLLWIIRFQSIQNIDIWFMLEQTKLLRVPLWIGNRNHNHKCYIMFTSYLHCRFCRILELTSTVHVCTTSTYFTNIFSSNKRKKCPASAWAVLYKSRFEITVIFRKLWIKKTTFILKWL